MARGAKWCDRALVLSTHFIGLCTSEKQFNAELKRLKVEQPWPKFSKSIRHATCHYLESDGGKQLALVCLHGAENRHRPGIEIAGVLVHEAVHIWQAIREDLGEKTPSSEFEAYAVQNISQQLMQAYIKGAKP